MEVVKRVQTRWTFNGKILASKIVGAASIQKESKDYYIRINRQWVKLCPNKKLATQMAATLLDRAAKRSAGVLDPIEENLGEPIEQTIQAYREHLMSKGNEKRHTENIINIISKIANECGWFLVRDVESEKAIRFINGLSNIEERPELPFSQDRFKTIEVQKLFNLTQSGLSKFAANHGIRAHGNGKARYYDRADVESMISIRIVGYSPTTKNHYRKALKAFGAWLEDTERTPNNRLRSMRCERVTREQTKLRRAISLPEVGQFLKAVKASLRTFRGLNGEDRFVLYAVAFTTALRANAIASLTPKHFDFDSIPCSVHITERSSKSRKQIVQPLRIDMAEMLKKYLEGKPTNSKIWPTRWREDASEMVRADLEQAGIPLTIITSDGPARFDFHAIRHTALTLARQFGNDLRAIQVFASHSSPEVTARYSHVNLADQSKLAESIPFSELQL